MTEPKTKVVSELRDAYDYVIVGGGASGCIIASRLSEDSDVTVLLLEAGGDDAGYEETYVPAMGGFDHLTDMTWPYLPVPQKHACKGMKDNRPIWTCGRALGGGGTVNSLVWMRGVPGDYDLWEKMGCEGWGYKDVLPYFLKSENMTSSQLVNNGYHATGGPISISEPWVTPLADAFVRGAVELGYKMADFNSGDPFGFMRIQANIGNGVRQSTSRTHLRPAMDRTNLDIAINTMVTKVLLENKTAVGVLAVKDGKTSEVRANMEVILCAGAIQSPKILMLSGIGPRDHLESLGIPLVADLPVGDTLTDHVGLMWPVFTTEEPVSITRGLITSKTTRELYDKDKTGPLAGACFLDAAGYIPTAETDEPRVARYQITMQPNLLFSMKSCDIKINFEKKAFESMFDLPTDTHGFLLYTFVSHPKSTGTLRLRSTNPDDHPLIDPNYLSHPDDKEVLVEGVKLSLKLAKTKPFRDFGTRLLQKAALPGFKVGDEETDEYIREMVQTFNNTTFHYVATCKMGALNDATAVLDPQLRVKGIKSLRVIDSSVMPEMTSGNIHAPTIMVAERGADIIKGKKLPQENLGEAQEKLKTWQQSLNV